MCPLRRSRSTRRNGPIQRLHRFDPDWQKEESGGKSIHELNNSDNLDIVVWIHIPIPAKYFLKEVKSIPKRIFESKSIICTNFIISLRIPYNDSLNTIVKLGYNDHGYYKFMVAMNKMMSHFWSQITWYMYKDSLHGYNEHFFMVPECSV